MIHGASCGAVGNKCQKVGVVVFVEYFNSWLCELRDWEGRDVKNKYIDF